MARRNTPTLTIPTSDHCRWRDVIADVSIERAKYISIHKVITMFVRLAECFIWERPEGCFSYNIAKAALCNSIRSLSAFTQIRGLKTSLLQSKLRSYFP